MRSRITGLANILLAATLIGSCTERNPDYCEKSSDCTGGRVCNIEWRECVSPDASTQPDGPIVVVDGDTAGDAPLVAEAGEGFDGGIVDGGGKDRPGPDARVIDAAATCGVNADCTDPTKAFCVGNACVGCQLAVATACTAPTAVCDSTSGKCVACTSDSQCTTAAAPICDKTKNACVACATDLQCQTKSTGLPACRADGQCVQCTAGAAAAVCTGATPACDTATNTCVQCTSGANCSGTTPICGTAEKCQACALDTECSALNDPARAACATTGACVQCTATNATKCTGTTSVCNTTTNACVECLTNATCAGAKPICATATNTCRGCAGAADCAAFAGRTACATTGSCVQCTDNTTCAGTTPICGTSTNTCRKCSVDSECSGAGPGVCMIDGHCATDTETIYVGTSGTSTCSDATGTGSSTAPVCSLQAGVTLAKTGSKAVVVVRGTLAAPSIGFATTIAVSASLTVVGKNSAVIVAASGADGIDITSGTVYLRNLAAQGVTTAGSQTGVGISAQPSPGNTVTLYITGCTIKSNLGGILLNGAAFDIENTTVSNNAAGTFGTTRWGGILVNNPPSTGPTILNHVTIQTNAQVGLSCSAPITTSTTVLSSGNVNGSTDPADQISGCGFASCAFISATCGAQSQPQ